MVIELYYKQFEKMRVSRSMSQKRYVLAAIGGICMNNNSDGILVDNISSILENPPDAYNEIPLLV